MYEDVEKDATFAIGPMRQLGCNSRTARTTDWLDLLAPYQIEHLHQFEGMQAEGRLAATADAHSPCIVDLDHSPLHHSRGSCIATRVGELLPCHVSHGCFWHQGRRRPMLCHEVLLSQGSSMVPQVTKQPSAWPLLAMLQDGRMRLTEGMSLGGLAWHLPTVGSIIIYLLGHLVQAEFSLQMAIKMRSLYFDDEDALEDEQL